MEPIPVRWIALPVGEARDIHPNADIDSLHFSSGALTVRLALARGPQDKVEGLDVSFQDATALRYLDELDLLRYWGEEGFVRGYPVLEVIEGGWSDEETVLQQRDCHRREWLLVTGNGCLSVFAPSAPELSPVQWHVE